MRTETVGTDGVMPAAGAAVVFVVPGSLSGRTGGYEYDRRIIDGLRALGSRVDVRELAGAYPHPDRDARERARAQLASIPDGSIVVVDGLAYGAIPDEIERECRRLRFVAIVHLPLAHAIGLTTSQAAAFKEGERRALACAELAIATGRSTCGILTSRYRVPADRVALVEPGTDPAAPARGSGDPANVHLLCVGAVTRGKGQAILVEALARVPQRSWRLRCVGTLQRDRGYARLVRSAIEAHGLNSQVTLLGELDRQRLNEAYDCSDVFVLATEFETYGMAAAEAIARGLPVIGTQTGALSDLVGTHAGRLVRPGDVNALARALDEVIGDAVLRGRLRDGALEAARRLPSWDAAVRAFATALRRIA